MKRILVSGAVVVMLSHSGLARSQSVAQATPSAGLEEIVVTAQRRAENTQDVPLTVSAISASTLNSVNATTLQDVALLVSGFQGPGTSDRTEPHLRGIGTQYSTPGNESAVAFYIDDIYITDLNNALLQLNDVDQVEVLKGPQGTLFGRNTTGGLISITTRTPGDKFEAEAQAGYANYDTVSGSIYVAGPIADHVAANLSFVDSHQGDGWGTNLADGHPAYKTDRDLAARSKWLFDFSDDTKLTLIGDYAEHRGNDGQAQRQIAGTTSLLGTPGIATGWNIDSDVNGYTNAQTRGLSARLDHDFGFATLSSITGYREDVQDFTDLDGDLTPLPLVIVSQTLTTSTYSEELKLASQSSGPFVWTTGLYYYYAKDDSAVNSSGAALPVLDAFADGHQTTKSGALYAQGTYALTQSTHLTLGGRYTKEDRDLEQGSSVTLPGPIVVPSPNSAASQSNDPFTWHVVLDNHLSKDVMGYVSVSRGFKSGGYNLLTPGSPAFEPETLTTYEVGLKSLTFDRRVRLNLAAFYNDYSNIQVAKYGVASVELVNGAAAKTYGLDADFEVSVTQHFTISGGLEALHATFTRFEDATISTPLPTGGYLQVQGSADGNHLPQAPDFSGTVLGTYSISTQAGEFRLAASYAYNSETFFEPDNRLSQGAYGLVGASLLWIDPNKHFTVQGWGKNLTNQQVAAGEGTNTLNTVIALNAPRTYGITFGYKY
jgi:iron complex outermembrane recepter protein